MSNAQTDIHADLIPMPAGAKPVRQPAAALTPLDMLNAAVERGADVAVMERLMGLHERWEAGQARKAFDNAIAAAKGEIPPIVRNRAVDFTSSKGRTNYRYEDLAEITRVVDPILNRHGLTYRFRSAQEGNRLRVSCILSHRDGYSEETSLEAAEDHSGNKNSIQAIGSAATYLQRYTLKLALGLAVTNDDDGRATSSSTMPEEPDVISDEQVLALRDMIETVEADEARFCKVMRFRSLPQIPANQFERAMAELVAYGKRTGRIK